MNSGEAMSNALKIELGRRYRFSASHRLRSPHLTEEENCRVFGNATIPMATVITTWWKSACRETLTRPRA